MAVFQNCSFLLELKNLPFKERRKLKSAVTGNGGNICFVVNKQCSLAVTSDVSNLSANRLRSIQRYQTPLVGLDYVYNCLERGVLLPVDEYKLDATPPSVSSPTPPLSSLRHVPLTHEVPTRREFPELSKGQMESKVETEKSNGRALGKFRIYTETDTDLPTFPDNFQVAKYSIFEKMNSSTQCVLELQSFRGEKVRQYRVVSYCKNDGGAEKETVADRLVFLSTSEDALEVYQDLRRTLQASGLQLATKIPQDLDLGSTPLQQLLLEEKLNTGVLHQDVAVFVELVWTEALGCLGNILSFSIDKLSLNDVSRAEGLLIQAQRKLREANRAEAASLLGEVYTLLPHREATPPPSAKLISQKLDLCQLIKDILNVSEMTLRNPAPSSLGKYRALRCSIEAVPPSSFEFQSVTSLLQHSKLQIQQVLRVSRGVELQTFQSQLGNIKSLLHSSSASNFVGILSRGLLLPCVGVEHHGIDRTDVGNLGSGIYFSDSMSTCLKYSKPSETNGSRLLLVCDVALGRCKDVHKRDITLTQAPGGHNSVHAVHHTPYAPSEFEDDEYVVYSPDQVKLKYVVQFSLEGDKLKEFTPSINMVAELALPSADQEMICEDDSVESVKNLLGDIKAGLMDRSGQQLPLQAVSVKCKLMDLLSQVVIFQTYTNLSSVPIEAKYVFPLADSAAVCGFEAFINGKHVVGQVKEKETARKEYKQAVEKGHGAYLMDQDAPDVFTISVGNLMPGATVLIKVTFVSELIVKDGNILFSLPGSVAPWQESAALNQTTQVSLEKVYVTEEAASKREFTLDMSIEMAYEITGLHCTTHKIKIKQTDCKAVVSVLPGEVIGPEGFQLSVTLLNVHLPRMWVENHPDKDTQACMLVFYPDFEINPSSASDEVVLMLDTSESMRGEPLHTAQRIALHVLKTLDDNLKINVILFGTDHLQAFVAARPLVEARQAAESFIKNTSQVGGSTELWRPLRSLSLLPLSHGIRNLLLLSDGHIQSAQLTLQLIRDNAQHSRLFTCGFSSTANRYMLRALAQAGGGAYEFFDTKSKHKWAEKVACQVKRMASPGCSSVAVKWQQFNPTAPPPVQAPKQLHALFNDCHTLVYGFVPHCMQATLLGNLSGQELKTMVSTSELQKTKGTFLHKLTARALIRDYEDGNLDSNEGEHEGQKAELKSFIIDLSKEFSILSQFTSFVAIEERDSGQTDQGFTDIPKVISKEDVDILPYMSWSSQLETEEELACITLFPQSDSESLDFGSLSCNMYEMCEMESDEETYSTSPPPQDSLMRLQGSTVSLPLKIQTSADIDIPIETGRLHRGAVLNTRLPPPPPPLLSQTVVTSDLSGPPPPPPPPLSQAVLNSDSGPPRRYFRTSFMSTSFTPVHPSSDVVEPPPANSLSLMVEPPQFQAHEDDHVVHSRCRMRKKRLSVEYIAFEERALHTGAAAAAADIPALAFPYANAGISFGATASQSEQAADIPATGFCFGARPSFAQADIQATGFSFGARATHIKPAAADIPASGFCFGARPSFAQADIPATAFPPDVPAEGALNRLKKIKGLSRRSSRASSAPQSSEPLEISPEQSARRRRLSWIKIFQMQHSEGYWELTTELGSHINMDVDLFANVFLTNKGIASLGVKAHADILKLVATLLVLQLMRVQRLEEGDLLRTLFCLEDSAHHRTEWWEKVKRAVDWVRWADQQYPCVYSRLEFGLSWESSTRQLLGYEGLAPFSALSGLKLQLRPSATLVH